MPVEIPQETLKFFNNNELQARIFYEKYALKDLSGNILEKLPTEMWYRLAREIASVEKTDDKKKEWMKNFYWLMQDFRFVPGGRILFGAGSQRKVTLLNCYYLPIKEDSLESIFSTATEMARTYSFGGGVGIDISILRPRGTPVNNAAVFTTGAASFMEMFSTVTGTIGQAGRRGALMITIDVKHPDVEEFVGIKGDKTSVRFANISVKITDEFMKAVESSSKFELSFKNKWVELKKEINAAELWEKIIENALNTGDPGVLFWDRMKSESPTEYDPRMAIEGTNPCAEQPLENYGACDLGSINLEKFVINPFTEKSAVDWKNLELAIRYAVRFLDNVLDYSYAKHALKAQADETMYARRIGLGIMGLANMLIGLNIKYDTEEAIKFVDEFFKKFKEIAYDESVNISKEKSPFQAFNAEKHLERPFIKRLGDELRKRIGAWGLRNCCILTIAPTGSISTMSGVGGGAEPIFALSYIRRSESLSAENFEVLDPLVKKYMDQFELKDKKDLPEQFVVAHTIDPFFRVKMQATIQKHIDSSISSTVNLASSADKETVKKIYGEAWKLGCKSITVYREGSKHNILTATDEGENTTKAAEKADEKPKVAVMEERPYLMSGSTIKLPMLEGNLYVTVNKDASNRIKEVFLSMGRSGDIEKSYTEAIGRLISVYLQSGGDSDRVVKTLKGIKGDGSTWFNGMRLLSVPDAVAKALELVEKGKKVETLEHVVPKEKEETGGEKEVAPERCPSCGNHTLVFENGCYICKTCGYTRCE